MIFFNTCSLEAVKALNRAFSRHFNIFLMTADALPRSAHAQPHGKNGRKLANPCMRRLGLRMRIVR